MVSSGLKSAQYEKFTDSIKSLNGDNFSWTYNLIIKHFTEDLCSGNLYKSIDDAVGKYHVLKDITQKKLFQRYNQISLQNQRVMVKIVGKNIDELYNVRFYVKNCRTIYKTLRKIIVKIFLGKTSRVSWYRLQIDLGYYL